MGDKKAKHQKIVMAVANNTYPADTRVRNEAQTLVEAGHQVTVIAPRDSKQPFRERVDGVQVVRYPGPPSGQGVLAYGFEFFYVTLATMIMVVAVWIRTGLDVLHVHNPPDTLFMAGLLPKLFGKKLIYDHHDLAPELYLTKFQTQGGWLYRLLLLLEKWTCQLADKVIAANASYMESDIERNGVKGDDITVIRNGPPLKSLELVAPDEDITSRAETLIGYLGHIAHQDGVDHLIKALYHTRETFGYDDWYAVIVGPGDDLKSLEDLAESLGIRDKIWFAGYQPESRWRSLLSSVDVCFVPDPLNPLNEKSTMIKMMDYMALGKPIVAYDMTENRVSGGDAVLYAKPNDPKDLARQLMTLVENASLREALGATGRQRISNGLAWEFSAANLRHLYQSIELSPIKLESQDILNSKH